MKTYRLFILMQILCFAILPLKAASPTADFDQANKLYEEGKFESAAEAYRKLVSADKSSSTVLFNLGNAHFKAGQIGRAIAAYRNAAQLTPRDPDLRANLDFARQRVSGPTSRPGQLRRWTDTLTTNEWTLITIIPVWAWFGLMIAGQIRPTLKARLRSPLIISGVASLIVCSVFGWMLNGRYNEQRVVVTVRESVARFGPLAESQSAFTANDGAELQLLDAKDDWYQVSNGAQQTGWMKTNAVERLR